MSDATATGRRVDKRPKEIPIRRLIWWLSIGALIVTLLSLWSAQVAYGNQVNEGLSLLSSANPVKVSASEGSDTAETHIALFNESPKHARIKVRFTASSNESVHVLSIKPERLPAREVTRVTVVFDGLKELREAVNGQLVISAGPDPIAQSVEVTPAPQPSAPWPTILIWGSLFAAVLLAGMVVGSMPGDRLAPLRYSAPGTKWEAKSWATTLTAIGGLLGTVLGGVTFPPYPEQISKDVLVNMNLFFGVLVVVGPFLFQALRRKTLSKEDRKAGRLGTNLTLLMTSTVTVWAVFGQLGAFGLLSWELISTEWLAGAAVTALVLLGLGAARYYFLTMSETVVRDWSEEEVTKDALGEAVLGMEAVDTLRIQRGPLMAFSADPGEAEAQLVVPGAEPVPQTFPLL